MGLAALEERLKEHQATSDVMSEIAALADQALQEIRTTSYLLHPPLLDEAGFISAAQWFVDGFGKRSGLRVTVDLAIMQERLPIAIETALFRVLQESLTNAHRHSGSLEVNVRFQCQADTVMLEIRDRGRGIPAELLSRLRDANWGMGVGLVGMRERLKELNCELEIVSNGHGTSIRAIVPLAAITRSVPKDSSFDLATTADALLMVKKTGSVFGSEQAASGF